MKYAGFLLIFVLLQVGCKRHCADPTIKRMEFQPGKGYIVPYQGNDTIKFLRNHTDTLVFFGEGWQTYFTDLTDYNCDGCCITEMTVSPSRKLYLSTTDKKERILFDESMRSNNLMRINILYKGHKVYLDEEQFGGNFNYTVNGVNYNQVYQTSSINYFNFPGDIMYFNLSKGMLKYQMQDGDILELLP